VWSQRRPTLEKGHYVLVVHANLEYDERTKQPLDRMDRMIEGLKLSDLE